jgi:P4 family phage/plasmid primase-like protien
VAEPEAKPNGFGPVPALREKLGQDVVLVPIPYGQKGPNQKGWQTKTLKDMERPEYLGALKSGNIGVLLGKPSNGLCSIDVDAEDGETDEFLQLNPALKSTLQTRGKRGQNFWVRIIGDYPPATKLFFEGRANADGGPLSWGEWRATGNQTVIYGRHPSGCDYQILCDAKPVELPFASIVWPQGLKLPWDFGLYEDLVKTHGQPFFIDRSIILNQPFFVGKFAEEHLVLHEPAEKGFYEYNESRGLWQPATFELVKKQFSEDLKTYADSQGESSIERKRTNSLLVGLADQLRGQVEKLEPFGAKKQAIHLKNGMLHLDVTPPELREFSPAYYSRNQSPIELVQGAQCPRFKSELLVAALNQEDVSLLQRWCGSLLLGGNAAQKILLLLGTPGGGKSTFVEVIEKVLGLENVTELRTDFLAERFELFRYLRKTLLTGKDVPADFLMRKGASTLKKLVGHDLLTPEGKNSNGCQNMRGVFNVVITANSRLKVKLEGDDGAWRRRLLVVEYEKPKPAKPVREFANLLLAEEAPGILLWMIQGAIAHQKELAELGNFRLTPKQEERTETLLAESDSIREFVRVCLKNSNPADQITTRLTISFAGSRIGMQSRRQLWNDAFPN